MESIKVKKEREFDSEVERLETEREKHIIFVGERYDKLLYLVSETPDAILLESLFYLTQTGEKRDFWSVFLVCKRWNRLMKESAVIPLIWHQVAKKALDKKILYDDDKERWNRRITMDLRPGNKKEAFWFVIPTPRKGFLSLMGNKSPQIANFSTQTKLSEIATNIATFYHLDSAPKEKKYTRILLTGMRRSGKTSVLHFVKYGNCVLQPWNSGTTNAESIKWKQGETQRDLMILDINRPTYSWSLEEKKPLLLLFVIDSTRDFNSTDIESTDTNVPENNGCLYDEFHRVTGMAQNQYLCVAVLTNKRDLNGACELSQIEKYLRLSALDECGWYSCCKTEIFPICAITGQGINKAIDWLISKWDK